mmetsp:Transcript_31740/g.76856  ORF Transcript_31740/g.76856 Transcript_31740/m.76856 type:complete len:232 (+) Transcript_31740:1003-1698(+)
MQRIPSKVMSPSSKVGPKQVSLQPSLCGMSYLNSSEWIIYIYSISYVISGKGSNELRLLATFALVSGNKLAQTSTGTNSHQFTQTIFPIFTFSRSPNDRREKWRLFRRTGIKIGILLDSWHQFHIVAYTAGIQTDTTLFAFSLGGSSSYATTTVSSSCSSKDHIRSFIFHKAIGSSVNRARARTGRICRLTATGMMEKVDHAWLIIYSICNSTPTAYLCKAVGLVLDRRER